jgi:hypothetical protein
MQGNIRRSIVTPTRLVSSISASHEADETFVNGRYGAIGCVKTDALRYLMLSRQVQHFGECNLAPTFTLDTHTTRVGIE